MGANGCFEAMNSNQSMTGYGQVSDRQHDPFQTVGFPQTRRSNRGKQTVAFRIRA